MIDKERDLERAKAQAALTTEDFKQKSEMDREIYKAAVQKETETYFESRRSAIQFAAIAIRSIILVNGAATLALLAFLGHIVASETEHVAYIISALSKPMGNFAWGTAAGTIVPILSYITQWFDFEIVKFEQWNDRNTISKSKRYPIAIRVRDFVHFIALLLAVAGIYLFVNGVLESGKAFSVIAEISAPTVDG